MALGKAVVNIMANLKPLKAGLLSARAMVTKMVSSISRVSFNILKTGLRKIISLAKLAAVALLGIGIASVKVASDSVETENLFTQSFGDMADSANKWAKEYSKALNLFEVDTKKSLGTFFLMITGMGIAEEKAFDMAKGLTELTADLASFRNLKVEDAFTKIAAGLTGESEPLKRLGIVVNESTIQLLAQKDANILARVAAEKTTKKMRMVGGVMIKASKATKAVTIKLTEQEKVMLRYKDILNKTSKDQGDMARTLNDTSNVFKQIVAQAKRAADTIGKVFLPEVTKVSVVMRDWLVNNQDQIKEWATVIKDNVMAAVEVIKELFALAKGGEWEKLFDRVGDIFKNVLDGLSEALKIIIPRAKAIGKAMYEGFKESLEGTTLGEFLGVAETAAKGVGSLVHETIGRPAGDVGAIVGAVRGRRDTAQLTPSGQAQIDRARSSGVIDSQGRINNKILRELQLLNSQVRKQNEDS